MTDTIVQIIKQKLRSIERILGWEVGAQTECCGLTISQRAVIVEVGTKGQTSLVDLAQGLGLDTSTLSRTINGLVNIGLVHREIKAEDRRYITLSLTEQGRAAWQRIEELSDEYFLEVLTAIPKDKHQRIVESFTLLTDALEKTRRSSEPCSDQCSLDSGRNKETKNG